MVLDLGRVVYLDPAKTGSTFLSDFLAIHSRLQVVEFRKHQPVTNEQLNRNPVSFIVSLRRPGPYYVSLFRYGLDGKGAIFRQLSRKYGLDLFQPKHSNFERFIGLVNHEHLLGLQSRRLIKIMGYTSDEHLPGSSSPSVFRLEDFVRAEHLAFDLARRQAEWHGFGRLAALVENEGALARHAKLSRFLGRMTRTAPRWKHEINRNRSSSEFAVGEDFLESLDSPNGPLGALEAPIFRTYERLNDKFQGAHSLKK